MHNSGTKSGYLDFDWIIFLKKNRFQIIRLPFIYFALHEFNIMQIIFWSLWSFVLLYTMLLSITRCFGWTEKGHHPWEALHHTVACLMALHYYSLDRLVGFGWVARVLYCFALVFHNVGNINVSYIIWSWILWSGNCNFNLTLKVNKELLHFLDKIALTIFCH